MLDDADCLQPTLAAWEKVRLSERHAILDQQGLQIADNREEASSGRGALKDVQEHAARGARRHMV